MEKPIKIKNYDIYIKGGFVLDNKKKHIYKLDDEDKEIIKQTLANDVDCN